MGNEHMHPGGDDSRWWPVLLAHYLETHHWTAARVDRYKTMTPLGLQHARAHRALPKLGHAVDDFVSRSYPEGGPMNG